MANCKFCGSFSGTYQLCFKCNKLKSEGKIQYCDKCNKFYDVKKGCDCSPKGIINKIVNAIETKKRTIETVELDIKKNMENCIVCEKNITKGILCNDCYIKKEQYKKEISRKRNKQEILDHYFSQKRILYKIKNPAYIQNGFIKLIAISEELYIYYKDNTLKDRILKDIEALNEYKNKKITDINKSSDKDKIYKSFDDEDFRKQWTAEHQCDDGHYVRSYSEMLIDNWLYNNGYVHCYEKSVFMQSEPEAVVISDFYLPLGNIYIEFWGLNDDKKYLERKEKKIKMYIENDLKLLSLEESDIKRLNDIMPRKLYDFTNK